MILFNDKNNDNGLLTISIRQANEILKKHNIQIIKNFMQYYSEQSGSSTVYSIDLEHLPDKIEENLN